MLPNTGPQIHLKYTHPHTTPAHTPIKTYAIQNEDIYTTHTHLIDISRTRVWN